MCKYVHGLVISEETNASQFMNSIQDLLRAGMIPKTKQNQAVTPAVSVMTITLKPQQLEPREQLFLAVQSVLEFCSHMVQIKIPLA